MFAETIFVMEKKETKREATSMYNNQGIVGEITEYP